MSLAIGIIGTGVMGADHARTIARQIGGAHVAAIADADVKRAEAVAAETGARHCFADPLALIASTDVDAVLIASPDHTHATFTLACLDARKPVLCEKPLAPSIAECLKLVAAEAALGTRLIQVGFMRRFDPAYVEMKHKATSGDIGAALILHCVHRNASAPPTFDAVSSINNSAVHEFDISRWLLDADIAKVHVFQSLQSSAVKFQDPMVTVLHNTRGQLIDIEVFVNAGYGYDIRGELVCEKGTVSLSPIFNSEVRVSGGQTFDLPPDWRPRFAAAYRIQLQAWVSAIASGKPAGASAWDGYAATAIAAAGVRSYQSGHTAAVEMEPRPALYA